MEPLDKLSLKELLDLNAAVQEELTRRIQELSEENIKLQQDTMIIQDNHDVSVLTDSQTKIAKNPSWIKTGKLKATANRFLFRYTESDPVFSKRMAHRDIIWDVRWNPSSEKRNLFASASADRTAKLWRLDNESKTANPLMVYSGHSGSVNSVRFHPTQSIVCTTSGDRTCHIWKPLDTPNPSKSSSEEDGDSFRSSSRRRLSMDIPVLNKPLAKLISHQGHVMVGEWSCDGSQVMSGSQDATIKIWDMSDWTKPVLTLTGHDSTVTSIAPYPSNKNVFCSSSQDQTIRLWDTRTSSFMLSVLHGHEKSVSYVIFDKQNPSLLISGSDDCTVKIWDWRTKQCLTTIHTSYVMNHFCQSPEDEMLCLPSRNASAEIYSSQGDPLMILSGMGSGHNKMIWTCDWNENGILTAGLDRSIVLWDVRP